MSKNNIVFDVQTSMREFDDNGYLHVKLTPISKACVNPYLGREIPDYEDLGLEPERIYYALRDAKELEKAVKTFNGLPLLMEHHQIDAETQPKEFIVGSTGTDATFEAPYLKNSLTVTDAEAIKAIEDGSAKEISCAYRFTPDFTEGEYDIDGQKIHYDFVMRDISGNHVALVREGRAGHDVAVADKKPEEIKRSEILMSKKRIIEFKKQRNNLANDANLGIEASEVLSAGFQKALNAIEAQVEGYDPREVGLDIDASATVDEIINKFMPGLDEETRTTYKGVLEKLKGATPEAADEDIEPPAQTEDTPCGKDEDVTPPETNPTPPATDDDWLDEKMKDPAFKEAFEMGIKYGEKREKADPEKIDREHESEGMKKALGEDSLKKLKEKIVADTKAKTIAETKAHYRSLNKAANKVKPLVGNITDPLAFDSANDIYAFALRSAGKNPENYNAAAYEGMVDMLLEVTPTYTVAHDSAFSRNDLDDDTAKIFGRLDDIE